MIQKRQSPKMHKKEIASIIGFLFLIMVIGLFYFNDDLNITGFAVKEEKAPEFYGTYSIKPSFKVNTDYDFEEYEEIKAKAKEIVKDCVDDIENCANKKINIFNDEEILKAREYNLIRKFEWSSGCGAEEERFFYDFVENYKLCLDSEEKEAICRVSLPNIPQDEKIEIKISTYETIKTKIELLGTNLKEIIDVEGPFIYTYARVDLDNKIFEFEIDLDEQHEEYDKNGRGRIKETFTIELMSGQYLITPSLIPSFILTKEKEIKSNEILFYKGTVDDKPFISLLNKGAVNIYNEVESGKGKHDLPLPTEFKPIKDTFKFCVNSSKKFYVYDGNKIELKNVEYKFALKLVDRNPPPPIEYIEIKDKIKDENSVLVLWDKPPVDDVNEYYIFYSEKDFKDDETKSIIEDDGINKIKISENEKIEIEDVDLGACRFIESGKPCFYNVYGKPLEKNKLYFWKKENRYIYVLDDVEEKTSFNFMVIAVDRTGNMINNKDEEQKITQLYPGNSIDDLPPGIINTIKAQSQGGKIILLWDRENYNLDGSISYDIESFNIYYKVQDLSQTTLEDNIGKTSDINEPILFNREPTIFRFNSAPLSAEQANCKFLINTKCQYTFSSQPELGKVYLWGVTALDEANNEHDKVFVRTLE